MSIIQFLRIFWARRWIIVAATFSCVIGGIVVGLLMPARWEAHSRVLLDLGKPVAQTGEQIGAARNYVSTQVALIKDYAVAGRAVDDSGALANPDLIRQYARISKSDTEGMRRWLAQRVMDNTAVTLVMPDAGASPSDIIDIGYTSTTPEAARQFADALRKAYIDSSLEFTRQEAAQNADWYAAQAQLAKSALDAADAAKTAYEKQNGLILQDNKLDVDSARLQALAQEGPVAPAAVMAAQQNPEYSALSLQLAQIDSTIAQDSRTLGPNHPELQELKAKRVAVAGELARQHPSLGGGSAAVDVGAVDRAVGAAKAKVIGEGDKIAQLRQLQAEVDLRRDQYEKTTAKAAELRQESGATNVGLTALGAAVAPNSPTFPNWPLIVMGSLGLGLAVGVLVALLIELFGRRVRGPEDLQSSVDAPLLAIIGTPTPAGARPFAPGWRLMLVRPGGRKLISG